MITEVQKTRIVREDPLRDVPQVHVEVKHSRHSVSCEDQYLRGKRGEQTTHTFLLYKDRLPRVQRMVHEDHEGLRIATEAHARKLAAYVEEKAARDKSGNEGDRREKYTRQYPGSVEAEYFALRGTGIKPLDSLKVLAELESPIKRREDVIAQAQTDAHHSLVAALRDAFPGTKPEKK